VRRAGQGNNADRGYYSTDEAERATGITRVQVSRWRKRLARDLAADPDVPPSLTHAEAGAKGGRGKKASDNITSFRGTSADYLVRRLKRDRPDIADALARGEYRSARAAALAAGIVTVKTPLQQLQYWWRKASEDEKTAFLREARNA
jgi:hypothetical protein